MQMEIITEMMTFVTNAQRHSTKYSLQQNHAKYFHSYAYYD